MKIKPNVPTRLPKRVPLGYRVGIDGWSFPREKLEETLLDGTRKLLTLDVSISPTNFVRMINKGSKKGLADRVNEYYPLICPHNCPSCFEKGDVRNYLLSWDDTKRYALEPALELALESVKFLGPGELIANPDLFRVLDYLQEKNVKIGIFTKGAILGDDELARKHHRMDAEELVKSICGYEITRVLIDCRSFDVEKSNRITPSKSKNYTQARNRAIELLTQSGMNTDLYCQRMSLQTNPVTPENIDDVLELFMWGVERNIPVCVTPTMVSGLGHRLVQEAQQPNFQERLIQLYTDIYAWLIYRDVMTVRQLREEGVSSYAGMMPCNQLSCGMFIRKDGVVLRCPGNDSDEFIIADDVRVRSLKDIWTRSRNYALGPVFNNRCVKDGYSIPDKLYDEVLRRVELKF